METRGLRFRVYYGYNPNEYISIPDTELERAEYAWKKNAIFSYGGKQVKGAEFKRIEEDYRFYTGWFDNFSPKDGEDFAQINRDMPDKMLFNNRLQQAQQRVQFAIQSGKEKLLSNPEQLDALMLN